MKASFYVSLIAMVFFFSCKKEETIATANEKTNVVPFTQMTTTTTPTTTAPSNSVYVNKEKQQESVMYQYKYTAVKNPSTTTTASATVTPAGMNPPHGQPKHRCDIPVGSPLNTPVAKTVSTPKTTVVSTPVETNTTVTVPPLLATTPETTPTPEGMNPPHGQAKHRCDIAVGAPLPKE